MQEANREESSPQAADDGRKKVRRWTIEEHNKLQELVRAAGGHVKWPSIAEALNTGRTSKQCRERYLNARPENKKGSWTAEEEVLIAKLHSEMGPSWSKIARKLAGRNENDTKNHWNALLRCKTLENRTDSVLGCYARLVRDGAQACPATFEQACRQHQLSTCAKDTPSPQPASSSDSPPSTLPHEQAEQAHLERLHACVKVLAKQRPTPMLNQLPPIKTENQQQCHIQQVSMLQRDPLQVSKCLQQQSPAQFTSAPLHGQQQLQNSPYHCTQHTDVHMLQYMQQQQPQQQPGFSMVAGEMYRTSSSASSDPEAPEDEEPCFQSSCDSLEAAMYKARHDAYMRLTQGNSPADNGSLTARLATTTAARPGASLYRSHNPLLNSHDPMQGRHGVAGGAYLDHYSAPNSAHSSSTQLNSKVSELVNTYPFSMPIVNSMLQHQTARVQSMLPTAGSSSDHMGAATGALQRGDSTSVLEQTFQQGSSGLLHTGYQFGADIGNMAIAGTSAGTMPGMQHAGSISGVTIAGVTMQPVGSSLADTVAKMQMEMQLSSMHVDRMQANTQPGSRQAGSVAGWGCDEGMLDELEQLYPQYMAAGARRPSLKRWFSDLESATNTGQAHKLVRGAYAVISNSNTHLPDTFPSSCTFTPQLPPHLSTPHGNHVTPASTPAMAVATPQVSHVPLRAGSGGSAQFTHAMSNLELNTHHISRGGVLAPTNGTPSLHSAHASAPGAMPGAFPAPLPRQSLQGPAPNPLTSVPFQAQPQRTAAASLQGSIRFLPTHVACLADCDRPKCT